MSRTSDDGEGARLPAEGAERLRELAERDAALRAIERRRRLPLGEVQLEALRFAALQVAATRCGCTHCRLYLETPEIPREHPHGILAACDFEIASRMLAR